MLKTELSCTVERYASGEALPAAMQEVLSIAQQFAGKAYAPYSGFQVGAAVLLSNGLIFGGNNQENIAYPSGLCAERTALFSAFAQLPSEGLVGIALCAQREGVYTPAPVTPCGACRQVLSEYATRAEAPVWVLMYGGVETLVVHDARTLLPLAFTL